MRVALLSCSLLAACAAPGATSGQDAGTIDGGASDGGARDAGRDAPLPTPGCPDTLDRGVCSGLVDPTSLGAGIEPVSVGLAGTGAGSHWYCTPAATTPWNDRALLYLVGTYGDPADDHQLARRACELGFVAFAPMYENRVLLSGGYCGDDGECYERYRAEIVDGIPGAPDPVDVDEDDSIRNRVATLLAHLAARGEPWATVASRLAAHDYARVAIAGHSQGAGHALYLAREEAAERVVMLAGPAETVSGGASGRAPTPWIAALRATPLPTARRLAYIHDDDSFQGVAGVLANWDAAGVDAATCGLDVASPACRRVRVPSDECAGLAAHLVPIDAEWGPRCVASGRGFENRAAWDHLLLAE